VDITALGWSVLILSSLAAAAPVIIRLIRTHPRKLLAVSANA
jgi:hypothetical protein